jgi:hypothetical protein
MYTKIQFGKDLKQRVAKRENIESIGRWAFNNYWEHILDIEDGVRRLALDLGTMELGPEFVFSYEELDKIADDLIAGKEVKL